MSYSISISTNNVSDTTITINYSGSSSTGPISVSFYKNDTAEDNIIYIGNAGNFNSTYTYSGLTINTSYSLYATITDINSNLLATSNTLTPTTTCFLKKTKILCENNIYKNIEDLNIDDIIITTLGNKKIKGIQKITHSVKNTNNLQKIYKLSKLNDNNLIDDLYITGGHSILVNYLSDNEIIETKKYFNNITPMIDDKYKLLACIDKRFEQIDFEDNVELYHILLENNNINEQYAIYANGILTETISELAYKSNNNI